MQSIGPFVVRQGDWKLCVCPGSGSTGKYGNRPLPKDAWSAAVQKFGRSPKRRDLRDPAFVQLFNLNMDIHEDHDVSAQYPDKVADLMKLLAERVANGRSTRGPKLSNDRPRVELHQRLPEFIRATLN